MDKELIFLKKLMYMLISAAVFAALFIFPDAASNSVADGLQMSARTIIPSLFPFFAAVNLMNELGTARLISDILSPFGSKLFGISGHGVSAFIIGITGGYPLGADYIAQLRQRRLISQEEASALLVFCNNSGPAFIVGAAGIGAFSSVKAGVFLYAVHILAALTAGIVASPKFESDICFEQSIFSPMSFSKAITVAIKRAAEAVFSVCAFITAFSAVCGIIESAGVISSLAGELSHVTGAELSWCRALIYGFVELGNGIGHLSAMTAEPQNLALAAFILSWGGLSVHFQTFAIISQTDIKTARYMIGRLFTALLAAALALFGALIIF